MFLFIFLLRTHYESTHRLCGEKWWPEIRLRSQAAPHVILPEFTFLRQSHCSVMLNCFILPVYNKMFGVFRTKLQRQNQGFLGGLTHTVIYLKLTQNISIISRTKGLIVKTFATLRNGKKINTNRNQPCKFLVGKVKTRSFGCLAPNLSQTSLLSTLTFSNV